MIKQQIIKDFSFLDKIFLEIKKNLETKNINKRQKQILIEENFSQLNIKKKEGSFELSTFWKKKILYMLKIDFKELNNILTTNYKIIKFKKNKENSFLFENWFKKLDIKDFIVFIIFVIIQNIHEIQEEKIVEIKSTTFLNKVIEKYFICFEDEFKVLYKQEIKNKKDTKIYFEKFTKNYKNIIKYIFIIIFDNLIFYNKIFKYTIKREMFKTIGYYEFLNLETYRQIHKFIYTYSMLPLICKPKNWLINKKNGELIEYSGGYFLNNLKVKYPLVHRLKKGVYSIKLTKWTINVINLLQKKVYKINKYFLNLLQNYDIYNMLNVKTKELFSINETDKNIDDYLKLMKHLYMIKSADTFKDEKLCFASFFDFRLRFYPYGWSFHRASGIYKYLLETKESFIYTLEGINWLKIYIIVNIGLKFNTKEQYIQLFNKKLTNINNSIYDLLISNNFMLCLEELKTIFEINKIKEEVKIFYLLKEYYNLMTKKNYKSSFQMEYDQCSSGPQILAILSLDQYMAELTNIIPTGKKSDLYTNFLEIILNDVEVQNSMKKLNLNINIIFNRTIIKEIVMPTFYGLTLKGLKKKLLDLLKIHININENDEIIFKISLRILNLLNKNYFNTLKFFKWLKLIATFYEKCNKEIVYNTLNGDLIKYSYLKYKKTYKKYKNLSDNKIRQYIFFEYIEQISTNQSISFAPNMIQSIDGSLALLIIDKFYEKHKLILQPLHDSFSIHPNYINNLLDVIKEVYIEFIKKSDTYIEDFIIKNLNLSTDEKLKFKNIMAKKPKGNLTKTELIDFFKKSEYIFFP